MEMLHIYRRVSTDVQGEEGFGLQLQYDSGLKVAEQLGFETQLWDEGSQSSTKSDLSNRPVLTELLNEVGEGNVKHLYVYNQNRLSRNQTTWYSIGSKLVSNDIKLYEGLNPVPRDLSKSEDAFVFDLMRSISVLEQEQRMSRLNAGKFQRVKRGMWQGGPTPFGYEVDDKGYLKSNRYEAKWIKFIFEKYVEGMSMSNITKELFKEGVRTRRGNLTWSTASLRNIISSNNHYQGWYEYKHGETGDIERVECDRIVGQRLFNKARKLFGDRSYNAKGRISDTNLKHPTLLKEYLRCGYCGTAYGQKVYSIQYRNYYYCRSKEKNHRIIDPSEKIVCKDRLQSIKIDAADKIVWDAVVDTISQSHLFKEETKKEVLGSNTFKMSSNQINKMKRDVKKKRKDLKEVRDLIVREKAMKSIGSKANPERKQIRQVWEEQQEILVEQLSELENGLLNAESNKKWVDWVGEFDIRIERLKNGEISFEEKKAFLNQFIDRIEVTNDEIGKHQLKIKFTLPYVNDGFVYKDQNNKSKGYDILNGDKDLLVVGGSESKKK